MKTSTKKVLKYTGIILGSLILLTAGFGMYIYSLIPKPIGTPIVLQDELFAKPAILNYTNKSIIYSSASDLAAKIKSKQNSSFEIVTAHIAHIKNNNYKYNALIWLREREALREAQLADEAIARGDSVGPLHGVPITIKEMFWVKGSPSTMNAKMFGFTAPEDGPIVKQLKEGGAIVLGTTNVPYMLADYQTYGEVYPTGNNPYDTSRTPGGSTGGGAAAVAAGFSAMELGSDLGGSIRIPAAFCGLYGLKPSFGLVNITQGTGPDTTTKFSRFALASAGPLARTPEDIELMWNCIKKTSVDTRFQSPVEPTSASVKSLNEYRIAWTHDWDYRGGKMKSGTEIKKIIQGLIDSLKSNDLKIEQTAPDNYDAMTQSFLSSFAAMMMEGQPWAMRKMFGMSMSGMDDKTGNFDAFYSSLDDVSDEAWSQIQANRKLLIEQWETFFKDHDIFICPIAYGPAFHKSKAGTDIQEAGETIRYMDYVGFSFIFNATGHPSLIVPMGLNKDGLPLAIQLVGKYYSENELIQFAKLIRPFTPGFIKPAL